VGGSRGGGQLTEDAPHGGGASCVAGAVTGGKAVAREGREGGRGKLREMGDRLINPCDTWSAFCCDGLALWTLNCSLFFTLFTSRTFLSIFFRRTFTQ
jgi:hypothetical protein